MSEKGKEIKIPFIGNIVQSSGRTILGIFLGMIAGGLLIAFSGVNPIAAYAAMFRGAFNSIQSFSNVLVRLSPLLLGGIGVALGIKSGVWNTGIEGYMYLGAIGATLVAVPELGLPPVVHILLCFVVGMLFAGLWGAVPGYLRAYKGVNEVTCTIMMSYVAIYLTNWIVSASPLAQEGAYYPMSLPFAKTSLLPNLMRGTSLHAGPFLGLVICIIFYFILKYTPFGFKTRMLGSNPFAAQYAGINSKRQIVMTMVIGAMLGGLGGAIEVIGLRHRLYMGFVTGVGYESVAVALVAGGNPIGVMVSALFFSILKVGGATMSIETGVSSSMASIIIALCVLFVVGVGVADAKRLKRREKKKLSKNAMTLEMEKTAQ